MPWQPKKDYTGKRFHYITVLRYIPVNERGGYSHSKDKRIWLCRCDCGKLVMVRTDQIKNDRIKSCGCMNAKFNSESHRTHGQKNTRLYRIWNDMKDRCRNVNAKDYPRYGGRGISICEEWSVNFQAFFDWAIENGYSESLSLDRIDNDGNYCPENCRWATPKMQGRNRRNATAILYRGEEKSLTEWCELLNFDYPLAHHRYQRGWTGQEIFETPKRKQKRKE